MLDYLGIELLDAFSEYYLLRYRQAKERGFDKEDQKFYWLYLELKERLLVIGQARRYLKTLPSFMSSSSEEITFLRMIQSPPFMRNLFSSSKNLITQLREKMYIKNSQV